MSADAAAPAVLCENVTLRYPGTASPAVADLSLRVERGGGVVITGAVGAGTSAVTRALVGLMQPAEGVVEVLGLPPADRTLRPRVGYCADRRPFMQHMRVDEAAHVFARLRGLTPAAAAASLEAAGLSPADRRHVRGLPLGDVRRLALACALQGEPELLVLDDPWEFPETVEAIRAARARGAAVVVATPDPGGFPDLVGPLVELPGGDDEEGDE